MVSRVEVEPRLSGEDAAQPQYHPVQPRCAHQLLGLHLVGAVDVGGPQRGVGGEHVADAMRVAGAVGRDAGGLDEPWRCRQCGSGVDEISRRVDVDPTGQRRPGVADRRNDRRQVNDRRRRHLAQQLGDGIRIREVGPPHFGGRHPVGRLAIGRHIKIGRDDVPAVDHQLSHGFRADQAERPCYQHSFGGHRRRSFASRSPQGIVAGVHGALRYTGTRNMPSIRLQRARQRPAVRDWRRLSSGRTTRCSRAGTRSSPARW